MIGAILFRAQPFHLGHFSTIQVASEECEQVYVFVGSADKKGTERNPLPIELRLDLIKNSIQNLKNVTVIPLEDLTDEADNSSDWGLYLYNTIQKTIQNTQFTFYYCDNPQIMLSWFTSDYHREKISFKFLNRFKGYGNKGISATLIRKAIKEDDDCYLWQNLTPYVYENLDKIKPYFF